MPELPKQDLLVKLLNMTTSDAESEVLMAMKRANSLLREAGWSWEKLIHEKIKIIESPFKNLGDPIAARQRDNPPAPPPPPQPAPFRAPPPPPPQTLFTYQSLLLIGAVLNNFGGHCYHCGWYQNANEAFWFSPHSYNRNAPHGREIICKSCDAALDGTQNVRDQGAIGRGKPKMGPAAPQTIPEPRRTKTRRGGSTPIYKPGVGEL